MFSDCDCTTTKLATYVVGFLGVLMLYKIVRSLLRFTRDFVLPANASLARFGAKEGAWAIVTGASDGIGKAYARELARRGFSVCLISRTLSKLEEVARDIEADFGVQTSVLAARFGDLSVYESIRKHVFGLGGRIGVLINNVGISYPHPEYYADCDPTLHDRIVTVNIHGDNTIVLLKHMVENGGGAIVNLSSISGVCPAPLLTTYSASKAYVDFFSQCINTEYQSKGIVCQSATPSMVVSAMSKIRRPSLLVPLPKTVAANSLGRLGRGDSSMSPYVVHHLMIQIMKTLGNYLGQTWLCNLTYKQTGGIRKAAYRKAAREAAKKNSSK